MEHSLAVGCSMDAPRAVSGMIPRESPKTGSEPTDRLLAPALWTGLRTRIQFPTGDAGEP